VEEDTKPDFTRELQILINRFSKEKDSDTPDFILARYIYLCLYAFSVATRERDGWYGRTPPEKLEVKALP